MLDEGAQLRAYLADRDVKCPGCGYNLRGLAATRCPECSRPFSVEELLARLQSAKPNTSLRVAIVAELLLLAVMIYIFRREGIALVCPLAGGAMFLLFLALAYFNSRFRDDPTFRRSEMAVAAWLAVAYTGGPLVIGIVVRLLR